MPKPNRNRRRQNDAYQQEPELKNGQSVCRIVQACGENIYDVENEMGERRLYTLPKRLRHVTFVKRGSFVFVKDDETRMRNDNKVRGDIEVVILDHFLPSLRKRDFWPTGFKEETGNNETAQVKSMSQNVQNAEESAEEKNEEEEEDWEIGMGNPNRDKWRDLGYEDDSEESIDD